MNIHDNQNKSLVKQCLYSCFTAAAEFLIICCCWVALIHPSMSCNMESGCTPPHGQVFGVWRLHEHEVHIEGESPESDLQHPRKHWKAFLLPSQESERWTGKRKAQGWWFGINTFMKVRVFLRSNSFANRQQDPEVFETESGAGSWV